MNYLKTICRISVVGLSAFGFAHNTSAYGGEQEVDFDSNATTRDCVESCVCEGLSHLLGKNPREALNQFEQALLLKQQCNSDWDDNDFLITFCQLIAYDQLGLQEESASLQRLLVTSLTNDLFKDSSEEIFITNKESSEAAEFLNRLTTLAPSEIVRQVLRSMIAGSSARSFQSNPLDQQMDKQQLSSTSKFVKR